MNFVNCPRLENVSRMFGQDADNKINPRLSGKIPFRFFFHGLSAENEPVEILGTNERTESEKDGETVYEYGELQSHTNYKTVPNSNIKNISYCFQHCNCDYNTDD